MNLPCPLWLDALLIAPFRWPASPYLGMWLGSTLLALWCLILGELSYALVFLLQRRRLSQMQDDMVRLHNLSVDAIHSGDKVAYLAVNSLAQEKLGNNFFATAAAGMTAIWPLPFALAWMAQRFEGIVLYHLPGTTRSLGYVFVLLSAYIAEKLVFSRLKRHLPLFARIEAIKQADRERRGPMRPF